MWEHRRFRWWLSGACGRYATRRRPVRSIPRRWRSGAQMVASVVRAHGRDCNIGNSCWQTESGEQIRKTGAPKRRHSECMARRMRISARRWAQLEPPDDSQSGLQRSGGPVGTWASVRSCWRSVSDIGSRRLSVDAPALVAKSVEREILSLPTIWNVAVWCKRDTSGLELGSILSVGRGMEQHGSPPILPHWTHYSRPAAKVIGSRFMNGGAVQRALRSLGYTFFRMILYPILAKTCAIRPPDCRREPERVQVSHVSR